MEQVVILIEVETDLDRGMIDRRLTDALNRGMDKILDTVELIQAHKYLSDALPQRPSGSTYKRTFRLRRASRKQRTGYSLDNIGGIWYVDEGAADYAPEVIGPRAEQKPIHRGRWLSLEEIAEQAERLAPGILQEEIDAIQIL